MIDQLTILKEIDILDMEKIKLAKQQKTLPAQIQVLKEKVLTKKSVVESVKSKISQANEIIDALKKSVDAEKILLDKSNVRLNAITSNKEYDAVQNEITIHQQKIEDWEMIELEQMESLDTLGPQLPEAEKEYVEISQKYKPEFEKLTLVYNSISENAKKLDAQIAQSKTTVQPKCLNYYEKLLKSKYPLLLNHKQSNIVGELKNGEVCCSICGSELRKPKLQAVRKNDSIICCDDCGSILMWKEEQ